MTNSEQFEKLIAAKIIKDFGAVMRGLAGTALEYTWGAEYIGLSSIQEKLVMQDFLEASEGENLTANQYYRRIGKGNLLSYAECLVARLHHGWKF